MIVSSHKIIINLLVSVSNLADLRTVTIVKIHCYDTVYIPRHK